MKRSGFKPLSLEEVKEKTQKRRNTLFESYREGQRLWLSDKPRQTASLKQKQPISREGSGSQAAKAGKIRTIHRESERRSLEEEWKRQVREKDGYACQFPECHRSHDKGDKIDCHHVNPKSRRRDLIYVVANGKCLCVQHHKWCHDHPIQAIEMSLLSDRSKELATKERTLGVY